jgi:hypothetical protein
MGKQLNIQAFDQAQEHFHFSSATKQSARKNQKANKNCKKKKKHSVKTVKAFIHKKGFGFHVTC